jgi:osmotically-inducible protein OsmY
MTQASQSQSPTALEEDLNAVLASSLGSLAGCLRVSVQGSKVMLRGMAPSYAEKARAESSLRSAGYNEVDNGVRVVPSMTAIS